MTTGGIKAAMAASLASPARRRAAVDPRITGALGDCDQPYDFDQHGHGGEGQVGMQGHEGDGPAGGRDTMADT